METATCCQWNLGVTVTLEELGQPLHKQKAKTYRTKWSIKYVKDLYYRELIKHSWQKVG